MNAAEHVAWVRGRALAELDAGGPAAPANAIASVQSDLSKHPDTRAHGAIELMGLLALGGFLSTDQEVRQFVEGIR